LFLSRIRSDGQPDATVAGHAAGSKAGGQSVRRMRDKPLVVSRESRRMNTQNPYAPPRANVTDVVEDTEDHELAGRGVRLGATILDSLIMAVLVVAPFAVGFVGFSGSHADGTPRFSGGAFLFGFIGLVVWAWFTIMYVSRNGQTIAKKWLGIKVVRTDGTPASLARIFWLRNVVNGLLGIIPFYQWIDALVIFSDSRQCVHDKIADTIVVVA
jgi:uncharacterized RDD family membrane protein YckC